MSFSVLQLEQVRYPKGVDRSAINEPTGKVSDKSHTQCFSLQHMSSPHPQPEQTRYPKGKEQDAVSLLDKLTYQPEMRPAMQQVPQEWRHEDRKLLFYWHCGCSCSKTALPGSLCRSRMWSSSCNMCDGISTGRLSGVVDIQLRQRARQDRQISAQADAECFNGS